MSSYSGSRFVFVLWLSGCAYGSAGSLVRFSIMAVLFRIVSITRVVRDLSVGSFVRISIDGFGILGVGSCSFSGSLVLRVEV